MPHTPTRRSIMFREVAYALGLGVMTLDVEEALDVIA